MGATYAEIGRECGVDWRTVRKYLAEDAPSAPPAAPPRAGIQPRVITEFVGVIEAWLRADVALKGSVIHERLVAEHGFTGSYQRVKMFLAEARPRIVAELAESDENRLTRLHRRFEVVPGAQAQVDWGDEDDLLAHVGIGNVYSFHMTLSHSRDPFTCFTTSMDMALAAYRPTGKGRGERQVIIVRDHVIAGRSFDSIAELDGAFEGWLPIRRAQVHRTHGQVISVRAEVDRAALLPLRVHSAATQNRCFISGTTVSDSPLAVRRVGERGPLGPPEQKEQS